LPIPEPNAAPPSPPTGAPGARGEPPPPTTRAGRLRARVRRAGGFGAGMVAALVAVLLYNAAFHGPAPITTGDVASQIAGALASVTPPPAYSEQAYAAIQPSLVEVRTENEAAGAGAGGAPNGSGGAGPSGTPALSPAPTPGVTPGASGQAGGSLGSGVVIDTQGDILTSLHVVADARVIQVTFADGTVSQAVIGAKDPSHDIAVLQPLDPPATIVPATLGNPNPPVGSDAYVVGNPFGLDGSISAGVVSALGRSFQPANGGPELTGLIQVDAAVNPGNSGGPLVDRYGRVMGIVAALINPTKEDVFIGIGLAVPINTAGGAAGLPND